MLGILSSCSDDAESTLDTTGNVDILSFKINGVEGTINAANSTISIILPAGTDLHGLSPQVQLADGAQVTPNNGEALDFVDASGALKTVTYTVTNKDLYQKYKVTVDVVRAKISSFKIGAVAGDIDDVTKKITIYLPVGTNVTALYPVVEYTEGAVITPAVGQSVDFTNPVTYQLDYLGSVFQYEVTVILGEKPLPPLVIYNGEDVVPNWWTVGSASDISSNFTNPTPDAVNSTAACASIWRNPGDDALTGGGLGGLNIDPTKYKTFKLMVWKAVAGNVQLEIQGDGAGNQWLKQMYVAAQVGQWQELTFTLPEDHGLTKIHTILVAPQIDDTKNDPAFVGQRMYWDQLIAYPN